MYAFLAASLAAAPASAALTPAEQTLIRTIDAEQQRTTGMLQRWVDQNSGSHNLAGVRAVRDMVEPEFRQLGFTTEWIDMKDAGRAGHLVARHAGSRTGKRLLLIAHLDTVFEPDSPFQRWNREGDMAHGPGSGDDKGGIAVIVAALRAMQAAGTLKQANITIFMTGDEEDAGDPLSISRRDLVTEGKKADAALDFEDLAMKGDQDMGSTGRRSAGSWQVTVTGRSAHSSGIGSPDVGYGAIYELARILDQFRRELPEDKLTYNVGLIGGGQSAKLDAGQIRLEATGKTNIVAATAVARGDLRAISEDQIARTQQKMRAIVAQSLPGAKAEISFEGRYPPMPPTEANRALLDAAQRGERRYGIAADGRTRPGGARRGRHQLCRRRTLTGLVGLGPASVGAHTDKEAVDVPSIFKQAKRAAILMSRLAAERR